MCCSRRCSGLSIARARRHDLGVGVIFLDLDNFKLVNDSLGHAAGDRMLEQLADRLRECTRETDLVARQSGDEFLLLLSDLERGAGSQPGTDAAAIVAESVANRVHEALREPFDLDGTEFYASASLGISLFPQDAHDAAALLQNADAAMYQSKRNAPGGYVLSPRTRATRWRRWRSQRGCGAPWRSSTGCCTTSRSSTWATARWSASRRWSAGGIPSGGIVPPGEFIPLAEEMGLIEAIGDWVMDELHRAVGAVAAGGLDLEVSFNLSPRQLWQRRTCPSTSSARCRPAAWTRHGRRRDHRVDGDGRPRAHAADPVGSCTPGASRSRSTTSAPAIRRWPGSSTCRSTS